MKPAVLFAFIVSVVLVGCAHRSEPQHDSTAPQPARCLFRATRSGHVVSFNERPLSLPEKQKYFDHYKTTPNAFVPENSVHMQSSIGYEYTLRIEEPRRTNVLWQLEYAQPFWVTGIVVRYPTPNIPAASLEECETSARSYQGRDIVDVAVSKNGREFVLLLASQPLLVVYGRIPPTSTHRSNSSPAKLLYGTENIWPAEMSPRMMRAATSITFDPFPTIRIVSDSRDHNWRWTIGPPRYTASFTSEGYRAVDLRPHEWEPDDVREWRWNGHDWQRSQPR
jgi:hypothetical protein